MPCPRAVPAKLLMVMAGASFGVASFYGGLQLGYYQGEEDTYDRLFPQRGMRDSKDRYNHHNPAFPR
jgi:hypothetical protein